MAGQGMEPVQWKQRQIHRMRGMKKLLLLFRLEIFATRKFCHSQLATKNYSFL